MPQPHLSAAGLRSDGPMSDLKQRSFPELSTSKAITCDDVAGGYLFVPPVIVISAVTLALNDLRTPAVIFGLLGALGCLVGWPLAAKRVAAVKGVFRRGTVCKGIVREVIKHRHAGRRPPTYTLHFAYRVNGKTFERKVKLPRQQLKLGERNQLDVVVDPRRPELAFIPELFF
jgi:hypothetical protein